MTEHGVRILLYPISMDYDRRYDAEAKENNLYITPDETELVIPDDVKMYTLSAFMDACNDQLIDLENYWVSYIRVCNRDPEGE